jgi:hypothetical protein
MQRYHNVAIVPVKNAINTDAITTYGGMDAANPE